ncbi:MAG: helix-turn-helix transcriptional regulator [Theionarchaea archaeon]|nr:helix-turn-helix transcriptional regulator [Theionarchaea archaeon]MBU7036978.1 helix-turn-helix transcriptional regulator [Theionarchaea archaeon]
MMELETSEKHIRVSDFPPFVRVALDQKARRNIFSRAMKRVGEVKRTYEKPDNFPVELYGKKKGKIIRLLSEGPQSAAHLIEASELSPSAVYHFLGNLNQQGILEKRQRQYSLKEDAFNVLSLSNLVKLEEDPRLRRKYGISVKELELAFYLWDRFEEVAPKERGYAQTYNSTYTLADAVHRWRTGRTDTPIWALKKLIELDESDILDNRNSIVKYHLPPGIPVNPMFQGEYKLPVAVDSTLDRILIQLLQKLSKNHLYTFPKKRKWLFENLHEKFGEFDDSTSRLPSAITVILKSYYGLHRLKRSSARIPSKIPDRWSTLSPVDQMQEKSQLLLHIISLSSKSNGGFEITSRSESFLQDISNLSSDLGLGMLTVRKKHKRPHFRAYLSENKTVTLRRYASLSQVYPELDLWMRIPLNQIAQKILGTDGSAHAIERVCSEELVRFVESIIYSLQRKKKSYTYPAPDYMQYKEDISHHFWENKALPTPKKVEELLEMRQAEEENLLYA